VIHFLAGLPRSGSTLLASLLSQHPDLHVTATNDLVELVASARNSWPALDGFRAQGLGSVAPRVRSAIRGLVRGFYEAELAAGRAVLDKNRAWPAYIELMEDVLGREVRVVCTVRDVRSVFASFERLRAGSPLTAPHGQGDQYLAGQSMRGRAEQLLGDGGAVGLAARRLLDAFDRGLAGRLVIVPYSHLTAMPALACLQVFLALGLKPAEVNHKAVRHPSPERDIDVWGLPLHAVGPEVVHREDDGWRSSLPAGLAAWIDGQFGDIQALSRLGSVTGGESCTRSTG
jgi:sulfotransferase